MARTSRFNLFLEMTAWSAGSVLLAAYVGAQWHFTRSRDAGLQAFDVARDVAQDQAPHAPLNKSVEKPVKQSVSLEVAVPDMTTWSAGRIAAYLDHADSAVPEAVLRVRAIDLEVPVYRGITERNLNRGAAWIDGTAPLGSAGNAGLASHRDGYFRQLADIRVGDVIELQTLSRTQLYVVDRLSIVPPEAVEVLAPSNDPRLTLVTCYPFYVVGPAPKRFIVRARAARAR